jgi:hypothetical protein
MPDRRGSLDLVPDDRFIFLQLDSPELLVIWVGAVNIRVSEVNLSHVTVSTWGVRDTTVLAWVACHFSQESTSLNVVDLIVLLLTTIAILITAGAR